MAKGKSEMSPIDKIISFVEAKMVYLALFITLLMSILVSCDALSRYLFDHPIPGAYEITEEYLLPIIAFLSFSAVYVMGGHVRVTMLIEHIPKSIMKPIDIVIDILCVGFGFLVTLGTMQTMLHAIKYNEYSISILAYPMSPVYTIVFFGSVVLTVRMLYNLLTGAEKTGE